MSNNHSTNQRILLLLLLVISALFFTMIRYFLLVVVLAAIFSALAMPVYNRFERGLRGKRSLSAIMTLLTLLFIVVLPLAILLGLVVKQAIRLSNVAVPFVQEQLLTPSQFDHHLQSLFFYPELVLYREEILQKVSELATKFGTLLFNAISSFTYSAVTEIVLFFVFLYTMFFFLRDGKQMLQSMLALLPLSHTDQYRLLDKFLSVTRATLKGSLVVGMVQGSLAGMALYMAGIESALFWGTVMSFLSLIPVLGSALVWIPAVIYLATIGSYPQALGVLLFCMIVVGQIDNIIRPILVGRDTQMHELLIFFGTLGGIGMFGFFGVILGPIVAALFTTIWEMYAESFGDYLSTIQKNRTSTLKD
uniref:Permease n=1 Tax=Chlorobium chlorochromatii (strain CaD3) TaxID=340177 RepID=Q3AU44_CHLCH